MSDHFADRLLDAVARKGSPICVGIDPVLEMLPDAVAGAPADRDADNVEACVDAIIRFARKVLEIVAPLAPCVKFQSAYFERYHWHGVRAYYSLIRTAVEMGLIVIGDVKRGDIGSTSQAYAAAHLADVAFGRMRDVATPDAMTVNPMLGLDTLGPFLDVARGTGKGIFALVRTSNPGSAALQDAKLADGRTWSEMLADSLRPLADAMVGQRGWSALGAVVGATQPQMMASLRQRLPNSIFLLPGYGAQGATAEMTRAAFRQGQGAIVSASRSILYAHSSSRYAELRPEGWERCIAQAVQDMRMDLSSVLSSDSR